MYEETIGKYNELINELRNNAPYTGSRCGIDLDIVADEVERLLRVTMTVAYTRDIVAEKITNIRSQVGSLQDSQHYSGRYIKSILGVKDDEQTTDEGD